jgi:hypothetical protein
MKIIAARPKRPNAIPDGSGTMLMLSTISVASPPAAGAEEIVRVIVSTGAVKEMSA